MIHFVSIHLTEQVHAQALGFTKTLYMYGWGKDANEAGRNVTAYCLGADLKPDRIFSTSVSQQQDPKRFTFPEQIHGLPSAVGRSVIKQMPFTESMIEEALNKQASNYQALQRGMRMLDAQARRSDDQRLENARDVVADSAFMEHDFGDQPQTVSTPAP